MPRRLLAAAAWLLAIATLAAAADPVDWNRLDWRLDRALLVSRYLFHDRQPADPWPQYLTSLSGGVVPDPVDLAEFLALAPAVQAARRAEAAELVASARLAVLDRALPLRDAVQANQPNLVGDLARDTPGFAEAMTTALGRLDAAVVRDPTAAEAWYHLAFFRGLAGDVAREEQAHAGFFAAWAHLDASQQTALAFYREQAILDRAWALRDRGRYDECLEWLDTHRAELSREAAPPAVAPYAEALLVRALVHAERGEVAPAQALLPHLPVLELPSRAAAPNQTYVDQYNQRLAYYRRLYHNPSIDPPDRDDHLPADDPNRDLPVHNPSAEWQDTVSDNLSRQHRSSTYLRKWVQAWLTLRRGHDARSVARELGRMELELEFPPRLGWRWWQDQGLLYEALGEYDLAQVCWARAAVYRPFFVYHPMGQGRGIAQVHGLAGTGQPYFLAYGTFFTVGSLWSYAANAALACQVESDPRAQAALRQSALAHLDACVRRGLSAAGAQALRGRLSFLAEDYAAAETDLAAAWDTLERRQQAPPDLALMLGLCRFNREDWPGARPWLQAFVTREPAAHVGWQAYGLVLAFLGDQTGAIAALDRAVALAPDEPTYLYNRGLLHYRADHRDLARADFLRARDLWPENPQIDQMARVVLEPTRYTIEMTAAPVRMDLPPAQRAELADLMAVGRDGDQAGELADLVSGDEDARARLLAELAARHAADPSPVNRLRLAQGAMLAGQPELTQRALAGAWPDGLSPVERRLLLYADRERGDSGRAAELAGQLDRPGASEDVELLTIAATILLDHDRRDLARPVVERALEIAPQSAVLQELHRTLSGGR